MTVCTVQGRKGGRRQRNFEASDDDFTTPATPSQVLKCVLKPEKHLILLGNGQGNDARVTQGGGGSTQKFTTPCGKGSANWVPTAAASQVSFT